MVDEADQSGEERPAMAKVPAKAIEISRMSSGSSSDGRGSSLEFSPRGEITGPGKSNRLAASKELCLNSDEESKDYEAKHVDGPLSPDVLSPLKQTLKYDSRLGMHQS